MSHRLLTEGTEYGIVCQESIKKRPTTCAALNGALFFFFSFFLFLFGIIPQTDKTESQWAMKDGKKRIKKQQAVAVDGLDWTGL